MATPNPRTNILLGRGTKANLTASLADILEGEIVFATDENLTYVKSGGSLVASSVSSVNSQSGVVVLDADDIDDTSTTNKFATAAQLAAADSATQPGDNVSTLTNDANYIDAAGAPVQSVAGKTGAVSLVKGDVGLGNVDNTSDANKPISTATQSALNLKADLVGGVVPNSQLPSLAITEYLGTVANQTALLALTGQRGDWAIRTDTGSTWVLTTDGGSTITDWTELATPADAVASVNGFTGTVVLGPGDVGAATAAQGALADSATQPGDNISTLTNDAGYITSAGAPGTDLTYTASTRVLASSTGTDATLPEVVAAGDSGLMTGADKTKLDGIATGATNVTNNNQLTNGAGYITATVTGDFTVDTSTLKVDSTNNRVGVGQATPIVDLDVDGAYAGNITAVGALDIDCSTANYFTKTISANSTFTFSNAPSSRAYGFTLELTHTSGTITWPTSVKWPGDTAPALTTGKTHLFTFVTDDGGTRWRGAASVDYVN